MWNLGCSRCTENIILSFLSINNNRRDLKSSPNTIASALYRHDVRYISAGFELFADIFNCLFFFFSYKILSRNCPKSLHEI